MTVRLERLLLAKLRRRHRSRPHRFVEDAVEGDALAGVQPFGREMGKRIAARRGDGFGPERTPRFRLAEPPAAEAA